jgi:hypothetical protein
MVGLALLLTALAAFSPLVVSTANAVHQDFQVHFMDTLADGDHEPGVG